MTTWILTWNPDTSYHWSLADRLKHVRRTALGKRVDGRWSAGNTRHLVAPGHRCFLFRQGEHRGIVASGWLTSPSYRDLHWDGTPGKLANYVDVSWDRVLTDDDMLPIDSVILRVKTVNWNAVRGGGIRVPAPGDKKLEVLWSSPAGTIRPKSLGNATTPNI